MELDEAYLVDCLKDLVKIPSPPGGEGEAANYVASELRSLGLEASVDRFYNVASRLGGGSPRVLVNAHLDTVPPGGGWAVDPYGGEVRGGRLYGRGASDNKAGVAAMLAIAKALRGAGLRGTLILLFTSREEGRGKLKARRELRSWLSFDAGICLDHYIDAGARRCPVVVGCRGVANVEVEVAGRAWHSSEPERGVNAIYRALELVDALRRGGILRELEGPLPVRESLSVTTISGGEWPTMIPDRCVLNVNFRLLPKLTPMSAVRRVAGVARRVLKEGFEVRLRAGLKGYLVDPSAKAVRAAEEAALEEGLRAELEVARGWVDAAYFTNAFNAPVVCVGTMTEGQAHVKDEYVELEDAIAGARVALRALEKLLS
ncbi:MAG: M20/M25/M40 family metallo-hydrolase [Candidatus Nezhaarchaeota archaeon]|nr:M20/M25/M40 family metallo-hydrolase [Candidatus Nezhaarchaeota archaeon]